MMGGGGGVFYLTQLLSWSVGTSQPSAEHLCWYSTWMELVVNLTAFSLLSQITVFSEGFHEEWPSAHTDPPGYLHGAL